MSFQELFTSINKENTLDSLLLSMMFVGKQVLRLYLKSE